MPRVGLEPTTSVFERSKIIHDLASAATVIGWKRIGGPLTDILTRSMKTNNQNKLRGLSPRANYTDRCDCRLSEKLVQTFADREALRGQRGGSLTAVILDF
jgi:hypothetical protein